MPTSLGEAREVGRLPGRDPATPHGSEASTFHPSAPRSMSALRCATAGQRQRQLRGWPGLADEAMQLVLPGDLAGCPSRQPGHFSCLAKRSNQEKATPEMAVRLRGLPTPLAPKSGSVRNSLRSDSGRFFIRFRHQRRGAINGDSRQRQSQKQRQRPATATGNPSIHSLREHSGRTG